MNYQKACLCIKEPISKCCGQPAIKHSMRMTEPRHFCVGTNGCGKWCEIEYPDCCEKCEKDPEVSREEMLKACDITDHTQKTYQQGVADERERIMNFILS